ncbi:hypothetical protein SEA_JPANDJE_62 [Streptomyces phage JPandJE]|nr:hypothetical protein SEA_JPANDJE_62 [Streptomyces phage JPandJE]
MSLWPPVPVPGARVLMGWGKGDDPRDKVGKNPTGRPTKSSAGKRRQVQRKVDKDLEGSRWDKRDGKPE